jgi:protein-disulfide isomerase
MRSLRVPVTELDHKLGALDAELTLVEYADFESPYCGDAYWVVRQLERRYAPFLCLVFRHFPLDEIHPSAVMAAELAEAAAGQGKFWQMHDLLFENQDALSSDDLLAYAEALDLDVGRVVAELVSHVHLPRIREDFYGGVKSGVDRTPCFFINGAIHDDAADLPVLVRALERARHGVLARQG